MGTGASAAKVRIKSPINNPNSNKPERYSKINIAPFSKEERTLRIANQVRPSEYRNTRHEKNNSNEL